MKIFTPKRTRGLLLTFGLLFLSLYTAFWVFYFAKPTGVAAAWFDDSWVYRNAIPISSHTSAETYVYISATIDTSTAGQFQSDCGDLRFTDTGGNLLPYFISSGCTTATTVVHVFFDSFPAGAQTIYYYYGNPQAANGFSSTDFTTQATNYAVGTTAAQEKTTGPVAYWKFDDATGTNAQDSTVNNNDGTITGATWQTEDQCISGKCLKFSSGKINAGNGSSYNLTTAITVEAWVKFNSLDYTGGTGTIWTIISKGFPDSVAPNSGWSLTYDNRTNLNSFRYTIFGNSAGGWQGGGNNFGASSYNYTLNQGQWYQLAFTVASNQAKLYINGQQIGPAKSLSNLQLYDSVNNLYIGSATSTGQGFNGYIDEVKIYGYARTAAQIKADYASGKARSASNKGISGSFGGANPDVVGPLSSGLVGYWKADEATWSGTLNEVVDSSGNGNHGQAQGATGGKAYPTGGKFGNGGFFDGVDDYVTASLNGTTFTEFTYGFWFNTSSTTGTTGIFQWADILNDGNPMAYIRRNGAAVDIYNSGAYSTSTAISANTWYRIDVTYKSGVSLVYINGALATTFTRSLTSTFQNSGTTIYMGNGYNGYFAGKIDDVRVYNRALSATEIRQLANWAPGPVGYWNFDEKTGASVQDISGNGYVGTWNGTGTTHWITGKYGSAGNFNGSSDFVNISDNANLRFGTNNFTVESWVKFPISGGGPAWEGIVAKGYTTSAPANTWGLIRNSTNTNKVTFQDTTDAGGTWNANLDSATFSNGWHHIAVTRSGTTYSIYSDGTLTSSGTYTVVNLSTTAALKIGSDATPRYLSGSVDDVRIYNYARTAKQIVEDMNAGHPAVGSPVGSAVGYWKFDEGYGTTAFNSGSGGSALNGTLTQMASPATSTSGWTNSGKFGKALVFDGSNDYVQINDTSDLFDFDNDFSFGAWFKTTDSGNIINIISRGTTNDWQYFVGKNASNQLWCKIYQSNSGLGYLETTTTVTINDNNWHNVNCIVSGTILYAYLDGKLVDTDNTTSGTRDTASNGELYIGKFDYSSTYTFVGSIDEVKIYNYALTADEVKTDYNRGAAQVLGTLSDTSQLTGGSVASSSAAAAYCVPGSSDPCSAPVGEWNFEEGSGGSVNDTSGNANTGTWNGTGTTHWVQGKVGKAGKFNGSDDYVNVGNDSSVNITGAITLEAWVYPTSNDGNWASIISKSPKTAYFIMQRDGNKTFTFGGYFSISGYKETSTADSDITLNVWQHIAATYDGSSTLRIYVNGVQKNSANTASGTIATTAEALLIGSSTLSSQRWPGLLDQVRVYNYARTPAQIAWDYNRGGPVGWWKFDECQGATAHDSSGNSNSGTITVGASPAIGTCTTNPSSWYSGATGKFNSSLSFDGTDDYTRVLSNTNLNLTKFTVSFWMKATNASGTSSIEQVINKATVNTSGQANYVFSWSHTDSTFQKAITFYDGSAWQKAKINSTMNTGTWYHVVGTYDGSNLKIYLDGRLETSTSATSTPQTGNYDLFIGSGQSSNNPQSYFNGLLDDVRVFNYALTAQQVKLLFNEGASVRFGPPSGSP